MSSQTESTLKQLIQHDLDCWNEHDIDAVDELYATDVTYTDAMGEVHDRESLKEYMEMLWTAFPDFYIREDESVVKGDTAFRRFTFGGTMEGPFRGFEPNGESFELHGFIAYHVEDGQFTEVWTATNSLAMVKQLGLL